MTQSRPNHPSCPDANRPTGLYALKLLNHYLKISNDVAETQLSAQYTALFSSLTELFDVTGTAFYCRCHLSNYRCSHSFSALSHVPWQVSK